MPPMTFQYTDAFVTLAAAEAETLVRFYSQLLAQEPKPNHLQEFENSSQSSMSLCLEVDDLEDAIAHLTSIGYPPPGEITTASHGREIYAYDPVGNRLILHQSNC